MGETSGIKIYCCICKRIEDFGIVGKIENRPIMVFECSNCHDLQIQTEETYNFIKQLEKNKYG
jgi:uncharacterized protein YlaI